MTLATTSTASPGPVTVASVSESRGHDAKEPVEVSVVIPTRDRQDSLFRLLTSIASQDPLPSEIIVVNAGDEPISIPAGLEDCLTVMHVPPSLCRQRNQGIRSARGKVVLLCDDDIELPPDYLSRLVSHLATHPDEGAVTGALRDRTDGAGFSEPFPTPSARWVLAASLFQLSVWGDIEGLARRTGHSVVLDLLKVWYRSRGNTWSLAGWPLLTQVREPIVRVAVYSLGAALVRRDWLLASPYDERLSTHGIGDHYGVALGFPRCPGVAVIRDLEVLHHRAPAGRLRPEDAHFERVLALEHFTRNSPRFSAWNGVWLIWSLIGIALLSLVSRDRGRFRRTLDALMLILTGRNPIGQLDRREGGSSL